jgi:glycine/D-amino acid oxidase-like deaminating enzyme
VHGYILATGHEGEGIGLAPATADLVVAAVLENRPTPEQAEAFEHLSPDRFGPAEGAVVERVGEQSA